MSPSRAVRALVPAALVVPVVAAAYLDGPPPGHTGGFGEPTCRACHFDGPEDDPSIGLRLLGIPEAWTPGARYPIEVVLTRDGLPAGGFQLSARFAGGAARGRQAGALEAVDERTAVVDSGGVRYAQHAEGGTALTAKGTARWALVWTAPDSDPSAVVFHVAANAANDDASEFGDRIVTGIWKSAPAP